MWKCFVPRVNWMNRTCGIWSVIDVTVQWCMEITLKNLCACMRARVCMSVWFMFGPTSSTLGNKNKIFIKISIVIIISRNISSEGHKQRGYWGTGWDYRAGTRNHETGRDVWKAAVLWAIVLCMSSTIKMWSKIIVTTD